VQLAGGACLLLPTAADMLCPGVPSHPCRFYPSGARDAVAAHTPSGALLKAVLLGGASPMLGNTGAWLMQRRKLVQLQVGTQGRSMCMWVGMFWFWCQAHRMSWLYGLATTNPLSAPPPSGSRLLHRGVPAPGACTLLPPGVRAGQPDALAAAGGQCGQLADAGTLLPLPGRLRAVNHGTRLFLIHYGHAACILMCPNVS